MGLFFYLQKWSVQFSRLHSRIKAISFSYFHKLSDTIEHSFQHLYSRRANSYDELMIKPIVVQNRQTSKIRVISKSPLESFSPIVLREIADLSNSSDQVAQLSKQMQSSLRHTQTKVCSEVIDPKLSKSFPNLNSFSLLLGQRIESDDFKFLGMCNHLTKLDLTKHSDITDDVMIILRSFATVQALILSDCNNFTDQGLLCLHQSPLELSLRYFNISQCDQITDRGVRYLCEADLIEVSFKNCWQIKGIALSAFARNSDCKLQTLILDGNRHLTDQKAMKKSLWPSNHHPLLKITGLQNLSLANSDINDHFIEMLSAQLTQLTSINLADCRAVTSWGFEKLTCLRQLKSCNLESCRIQDQFARQLANLTALSSLDLSDCLTLSSHCAEDLVNLPKIQRLNLMACKNTLVIKVQNLIKDKKLSSKIKVLSLSPVKTPFNQAIGEQSRLRATMSTARSSNPSKFDDDPPTSPYRP